MFQIATHKDIPIIQHIAAEVWPLTYGEILSKAQLSYMLAQIYSTISLMEQMNGHHEFYILKEQGLVVGFIDLEQINEEKCKLHKIYLLPDHQGRGYGRQLIDFAIATAKQWGTKKLQLNVNRYNKAITFYEKMAFEIIETIDIPIGDGYFMNDFIMEKIL